MSDLPRRWWIAPLVVLLSAPIMALQDDSDPPADLAEIVVVPAPADPRVAITDFLGGMKGYVGSEFRDNASLKLALSTFTPNTNYDDLEGLGLDLYAVINRTALIDPSDFPTSGDPALGAERWSWTGSPPSNPELSIALTFVSVDLSEVEHRGEGVGWFLSAETLGMVSAWSSMLADEIPVGQYIQGLSPLAQARWQFKDKLPESLRGEVFMLETWQWLGILLLIAFGVIADRLLTAIVSRLARRAAGRVSLDDEAVGNFQRPFGLLVMAWTFSWALPVLGLDPSVHRILSFAASFVFAVAGVWTAYRVVDVLCAYLYSKAKLSENRFDDMLVPLLSRTLKILVTVAGLIFLASQLSEDLYGIIAGLSIGSLAVGFAAKDSIENLFGTFTVLLDKPFELGDWITVGSIDGSVEQVGFRSTRVRTFYDSLITVPNSRFIGTEVDNHGSRTYRRYTSTLGLTYDTPPSKIEAFCEGVRELIRRHPYTRKDSFHVYVKDFGTNSIDVMLYCFVKTPDWGTELRERGRLILDILRLAESLGVEFAFPTRTIHMLGPQDTPGHEDAPPTVDEALSRGREVAERLTPGDDVPPPVTYS